MVGDSANPINLAFHRSLITPTFFLRERTIIALAERIQGFYLQRTSRTESMANHTLVHLLCHQHIHAVTERNIHDCQQYNDRDLLTEEMYVSQQPRQEENEEQCSS